MKFSLLYLIIITSTLFVSCNSKRKIEKEKQAIIAVIEESTNAYKARELNILDSIYVHDETTTRLNAGKYGFVFRKGWHDISAAYEEMFAANPMPITDKYEKKEFEIKIYGKGAFCVHDESIYDSENEHILHQIGVHFLEKVKGEWKIVYLSYIDSSSYDESPDGN